MHATAHESCTSWATSPLIGLAQDFKLVAILFFNFQLNFPHLKTSQWPFPPMVQLCTQSCRAYSIFILPMAGAFVRRHTVLNFLKQLLKFESSVLSLRPAGGGGWGGVIPADPHCSSAQSDFGHCNIPFTIFRQVSVQFIMIAVILI